MFIAVYQVHQVMTYGTWFKIILSFLILLDDHIFTRIPVPWGHVMWHIAITFAVDGVYQDYDCHELNF